MIAGSPTGWPRSGPEASATWICAALSDADRAVARRRGTSDGNGIPVRMLDIAPDVSTAPTTEVANSTLWFLLHQLFDTPSQPRFGREFRRDWESYLAYNEAFADALTRRR
jgi:trehalose 6-phosphate synthase